jgi:hypothetical protein
MKLSTKTLLSSAFVVCLGFSALSQGKRNITKINLAPGPLTRYFGISQEFKLSERLSVQTMIKFMPKTSVSSKYAGGSYDGTTYNPFSSAKLSAIGNVTELRIYGKNKGTFRGFYFGPYLSYNAFKFQTNTFRADFHDNNNVAYAADVSQYMKFSCFGGGIQIGVQGVIKNLIVIDWTILGIGVGSAKLSGGIEATNPSAGFDFRNYTEDINKATLGLDNLPGFSVQRTVEPQKVDLTLKTISPMLRTTIAIGINY